MKKVGRNDPCPCGAKKSDGTPVKFKKCHQNKEVGGLKLPGGFAVGPMYFSANGKQSSISMGPPIIAFDYSVTNALNRLGRVGRLSIDEFQTEFNSLVDNLIADSLIYLQNRLKLIRAKSSVGQMNSTDAALKEYDKDSIDLRSLCDFDTLKQLDRVRGRKHHSDRRYDADYTIGSISYDSIDKLRNLASKIRDEIHRIDDALSRTHPSHEIKIEQTKNSTSIEFHSIGHALDLTGKGKIVPQKPPLE